MTDSIIILSIIALPCVVFLLWCLTPWGRRWLKANHMI